MPFHFDYQAYKNSFPVEVIESVTMPNPSKPNQEFWQMTFIRLQLNNKMEWEPQPAAFECRLQGCTIQPAHTHYRLYESDRPGSPAHRFITGLKDKAFIIVGSAKELVGKRLVIEEVVTTGGQNKQTGEQYRDSYNYYPVGVPSLEQTQPELEQSSEELPWSPPGPAPANGALTAEDLEGRLALLIADHTDIEARQLVRDDEVFKNNGAFMLEFLQGKQTKNLIDKGILKKDPLGVYRLAI